LILFKKFYQIEEFKGILWRDLLGSTALTMLKVCGANLYIKRMLRWAVFSGVRRREKVPD